VAQRRALCGSKPRRFSKGHSHTFLQTASAQFSLD
jgi:hypothetical protein